MTGDVAPEPNGPPREPIHARLRRVAGVQLIALAALVGLALVQFGPRSTGSATPEGVVPGDGRLVAQSALGSSQALLIERKAAFRLLMAYRTEKGWFSVAIDTPALHAHYAVTSSERRGPIPAFSAVYGRVLGSVPRMVRIRWTDGWIESVPLTATGAFLGVREGIVEVERVSLLDPGGAPTGDLER